jgi:hypothetical protein
MRLDTGPDPRDPLNPFNRSSRQLQLPLPLPLPLLLLLLLQLQLQLLLRLMFRCRCRWYCRCRSVAVPSRGCHSRCFPPVLPFLFHRPAGMLWTRPRATAMLSACRA